MNQINQEPKPLEKIIAKCEFNNSYRVLDGARCFKGQNPRNCPYELYFMDECYCKVELAYNKAKQIEFAQWMER